MHGAYVTATHIVYGVETGRGYAGFPVAGSNSANRGSTQTTQPGLLAEP